MEKPIQIYKVLGLMSGSSLDGLDLAFCEFSKVSEKWNFRILKAETIAYNKYWLEHLKEAPAYSEEKLGELHLEYGAYLGEISRYCIQKNNLIPDFVASHGHTVFHAPEKGFTFQMGDGQALAKKSGLTTICDFRSKDISLGGQGAPLVPIGDEFLFGEYEFCLNIGGIANISFGENKSRIAYDVCPANQLLNHLSEALNQPYDDQGKVARSGEVNPQLLNLLQKDPFYEISTPKSLSNAYVRDEFIYLLDKFNDSIQNKLSTVVEHIALQISESIKDRNSGKLLITGGGAHNTFLVNRIGDLIPHQVIIPDELIIDFKEALIFAFMGVLRFRDEVNCLSTVTGASWDCSGGVIFTP